MANNWVGAFQSLDLNSATAKTADTAAWRGCLQLLRDLRQNGVHATSKGANLAVKAGHLGIVKDLHTVGINVTPI